MPANFVTHNVLYVARGNSWQQPRHATVQSVKYRLVGNLHASETSQMATGQKNGTRFNVLSVDGGGYLGLATARFIADSEAHFRTTFHDRFNLFCGTSTGAIIALALASNKTGEEIVELYRQLGPRVFPYRSRVIRWFADKKSIVLSKYSSCELRALLNESFGEQTLGDLRKAGKLALITAFSVTNGAPRIFKTDHSERLSRDDGLKLADVALASAAAPTYFPLATVCDPRTNLREDFCDGGVFANHPALLGFAEAVGELKIRPSNVHVLSLSTPRLDLGERSVWLRSRGIWQWRKSISSIFIDGNSTVTHHALRRIIDSYPAPGPTYHRIELANQDGLEMDLATEMAKKSLEHIGTYKAASNDVRPLLAGFLK